MTSLLPFISLPPSSSSHSPSVPFQDDRKSASVQTLDVNIQTSFNKFSGKVLEGRKADFSDRIDRPVQYGFQANPDEYEMVSIAINLLLHVHVLYRTIF